MLNVLNQTIECKVSLVRVSVCAEIVPSFSRSPGAETIFIYRIFKGPGAYASAASAADVAALQTRNSWPRAAALHHRRRRRRRRQVFALYPRACVRAYLFRQVHRNFRPLRARRSASTCLLLAASSIVRVIRQSVRITLAHRRATRLRLAMRINAEQTTSN